MQSILDSAGVANAIDRLTHQLANEIIPNAELGLIGIRTRGVPLADRLAKRIREEHGMQVPVGILDITLYRDDLSQISHWPLLRGTDIPFSIDESRIILVDDVLYTGRTVRAAIDALCDLGRPSVIRLAVLIDRGHREFPIQADYVGETVKTAPGDRVNVQLKEIDDHDEVVIL